MFSGLLLLASASFLKLHLLKKKVANYNFNTLN